MKYYKVQVKCGHVGKSKYILKYVYIKAEDGKEAARKARLVPRVKHDHKDAIRNVEEIQFDEFIIGLKLNEDDKYFKIKNKQDQIRLNVIDINELYNEENNKIKYKKNHDKRFLKEALILKETKKELTIGGYY